MANRISVINHEYSSLEPNVRRVHADCIDHVNGLIRQFQKLDGKSDGFEASALAMNIGRLISEMKDVKTTISTLFDAQEEALNSFRSVVDDYDSL